MWNGLLVVWLQRLPEFRAVRKRDGRLPHCTAARLVVTVHTKKHKEIIASF